MLWSSRWSGRFLCFHCARVDGHSSYGVYTHGVQGFYFAALFDSSSYDELFGSAGSEDRGYVYGEALHRAFGVHVGVEEGSAVVFEPGDGFLGGEVDGVFPALDGDSSGLGVYAEDKCFFAEFGLEAFGELEIDELVAAEVVGFGWAEEAGAVDDSFRSGFEEKFAVFCGF